MLLVFFAGASDKHGVNVSLLVPLVRKSELSRSEIQILIDLLLNKQHEALTVLDEWSEVCTRVFYYHFLY